MLWMLVAGVASVLVTYTGVQDLSLGEWFVMFHADWCKHCLEVKPHFTSAAFSTTLRFLTLDCVQFQDLCVAYDILSFPTFLYLSDGEKTHFEGNYQHQIFSEYANKLLSPTVIPLAVETWQKRVPCFIPSFTLTYVPSQDDHILTVFDRIADQYRTQPIYFFAVPWSDTRVLFITRDKNDSYELEDFTERNLQEFIRIHRTPTMMEVSSDNLLAFKRTFKQKLMIVLLIDTHDLESKYSVQDFVMEAREQKTRRRSYLQFCFLDLSAPDTEIEYLDTSTLPALFALRVENDTITGVQLAESISPALVHRFVEEVVAGYHPLSRISPKFNHYVKTLERWTQGDHFVVDCVTTAGVVLLAVGVLAAVKYRKKKEKTK